VRLETQTFAIAGLSASRLGLKRLDLWRLHSAGCAGMIPRADGENIPFRMKDGE
jgi:hypothetical protein